MAGTIALEHALDLEGLEDFGTAGADLPGERAIELFAPDELVVGLPAPTFTARAFDGPSIRGVSIVLAGDALDLASGVSVRAWNGGRPERSRARNVALERVGSRLWARLPAACIAPSDSVTPPLVSRDVVSLAAYRRAVRARAAGELSFELELVAEQLGVADLVVTLHALDGSPLDAAPAYLAVQVARRAR